MPTGHGRRTLPSSSSRAWEPRRRRRRRPAMLTYMDWIVPHFLLPAVVD